MFVHLENPIGEYTKFENILSVKCQKNGLEIKGGGLRKKEGLTERGPVAAPDSLKSEKKSIMSKTL